MACRRSPRNKTRSEIEDAVRGRTTARPPFVNDSLLKMNALGRYLWAKLGPSWDNVGTLFFEFRRRVLQCKGAFGCTMYAHAPSAACENTILFSAFGC